MFVTILHCTVSMVLSGDLVAPCTDLRCSGGLPDRVLTSRKLSLDYRCPMASCVEGSGKHGSQTPTGRTTLQSIFAHSSLCFISIGPPYQRSLMRKRVWLGCATRGCVSRETSNRTMDLLQKHKHTGTRGK